MMVSNFDDGNEQKFLSILGTHDKWPIHMNNGNFAFEKEIQNHKLVLETKNKKLYYYIVFILKNFCHYNFALQILIGLEI